jgi:hypothetical protein
MRIRWMPVLLTGLGLTAAGLSATAQVSPGPLSTVHTDLEGNGRCGACHSPEKQGMTRNCLTCHREIALLTGEHRGLHGKLDDPRCASCHPDHAGREFRLIDWGPRGPEGFEHSRAGWSLEGRHTAIRCRDCHATKFVSPMLAPLIKRKDATESWLGLSKECRSCHADPHMSRLGEVCADCHVADSWHRIDRKFDHSKTRYPLLGRHAAVDCARCHDPVRAWGGKPAFGSCTDCHKDPHRGDATLVGERVDCVACHTIEGFRPSTYTIDMHDRSPYPLRGAHRRVGCDRCHTSTSSLVRMRPRHGGCGDCHADAHGGQLAQSATGQDCGKCHSIDAWRPAGFGIDEHRATRFPLEGRHAKAACTACHAADRIDLSPPRVLGEPGSARVALALSDSTCVDCHQNPHEGRFPRAGVLPAIDGCAGCHGFDSFRPAVVDPEDHDRLGYHLEGAHLAVACQKCHEELGRGTSGSSLSKAPVRIPALPFGHGRRSCSECHVDPHEGQFPAGPGGILCDRCHDTEAFRPASRFDHERDAAFHLSGAHRAVRCSQCHPAIEGAAGTKKIRYRPTPTQCEACHGNSQASSPAHGRTETTP